MYGLGAMRLQPTGYNWLTGSPNYRTPSAADQAMVVTGAGLPANCQGPGSPNTPSDLPAGGETCFMLGFPFIGKKYYGCSSTVMQGGYGDPYVGCEPIILKGGGFDIISPLIRLGATALIGWFVIREVM